MNENNHLDDQSVPRVSKRKVLYLCGFDPRGSGHYHTLYRDEAERNTQVGGIALNISARKRNGRFSAHWSIDSKETRTNYEFLAWDDIVRQYWLRTPLALLLNVFGVYRAYLTSGTVARMRRLSKVHFTAFLYPPLFISLLLLSSGAVAAAVAAIVAGLLPGFYLEWLLAAGAVVANYRYLGEYLDRRFSFYWVLRGLYFYKRLAQGRVGGLDERIDRYARHLLEALADEQYEEVLLVGHSAGTILLPMVVSRALTIDAGLQGGHNRLSLLTVGTCIHDVTLWPGSDSLRAAVRECAKAGLYWLDVTAPADGACYPLVDAVVGSGLAAHEDAHTRRSISGRFHMALTEQHYRALKRNRMRLHFQYLAATDYPSAYNYFDITAGSRSLRDRFPLGSD